MMADAKTARQTDRDDYPELECRGYSYPQPEETDFWEAADRLEALSSTHPTSDNRSEMVERLARFVEERAEEYHAKQSAAERGSSSAWRYHGARMAAGVILEKIEELDASSLPSEIRRDAPDAGFPHHPWNNVCRKIEAIVLADPVCEGRLSYDAIREIASLIPTLEDGGGESG
jgi:hypothetical protein